MKRIEREKKVIAWMITLYCQKRHHQTVLCSECSMLLEYACRRLEKCKMGNAKTSCRKCEIHCYSPGMREEVRKVMRYMGPRMIFYHPIAALRHLWDER